MEETTIDPEALHRFDFLLFAIIFRLFSLAVLATIKSGERVYESNQLDKFQIFLNMNSKSKENKKLQSFLDITE